ncbi:phosphoesterase PA-phosphatase [Dactylosporangium sp. CA-233914]|uniref:phosphoesterase PA-phosphatase n=1 Tax=Dactylosporangium sp. CA-233914 TaxID=3239934 RepID=UPI003D901B2E
MEESGRGRCRRRAERGTAGTTSYAEPIGTEQSPADTSRRVARLLTEVLAPSVLAGALPFVIAVHAAGALWTGLAWGLLASAFSTLIPYSMIWWGVRKGHLSDRHIGRREQRTKPLVRGLACVLIGLALLLVLHAPRELVALVVAHFLGGLAATVVNHFWKLSVHAAVASGTMMVLAVAFGPALLATAVLVVAVGWSRVRLRDHTTAQVVAGTILGVLTTGLAFALLR